MTQSNNSSTITTSSINENDDVLKLSDVLASRYGGVSVYLAIMLMLAVGIIWTAVRTAQQVQQHHSDYAHLQQLKREFMDLQIEHQRLIIEQQTFSSTPQIASRAVTQMGMFAPKNEDKLILQPEVATTGGNDE